MSTPTGNANQPEPAEFPAIEDLVRVVASYARTDDVEAAGFVFGAKTAAVGDEAVIYSRGRFRAGIVVKVGRVNLTVVYTTATSVRDAADRRYGWTEPVRTTKAAKFADVAVRPARSADPAHVPAPGSRRLIGPRQYDHNCECVGCGAHLPDPCHPDCPFETGVYRPAVLLRASAARLREHPAGIGYSISDALFAAALDLVSRHEATGTAEQAKHILADFLVNQQGYAEEIRNQAVHRHGLFTDLPEIARTLYAAAAAHDNIDFDPEEFGEFPIAPSAGYRR